MTCSRTWSGSRTRPTQSARQASRRPRTWACRWSRRCATNGCCLAGATRSAAPTTALVLQTAALAAGNMFHVKHTWQRCVDVLVPVTEYVRGRFIAAGFDPEQLVAKPNVVYPEPRVEPREIRRQVLFVGRDIPTKGLHVLIEALRRLGPDAPRLVVAGVRSAVARIVGRPASSARYDMHGCSP